LENRHINVEDKDEVRTYFNLDLFLFKEERNCFLLQRRTNRARAVI
jgi:hypothetical protein